MLNLLHLQETQHLKILMGLLAAHILLQLYMLMDKMALKVYRASKEHKASRVSKALKVVKVSKDSKAFKVTLEHKVSKVVKANKGL